jgi:hypothetical protein
MNDYGNIYDYEWLWIIMNDYDDIYGTKKGIKGTSMIYVPYNFHIR